MYLARIALCCSALLGVAAQAGAEETPYRHEYINGGYFEGALRASKVLPSDSRSAVSALEAPPAAAIDNFKAMGAISVSKPLRAEKGRKNP